MGGYVRREPPPPAVTVAGVMIAFGVGAVLSAVYLGPGTPNLVVVLPTPEPPPTADPVFALAAAAEATFFAPTPTPTIAPPTPTSVPLPPQIWCGVNAAVGDVCEVPPLPTKTPTPIPDCPVAPGFRCVWVGTPEAGP